MKNSKIEINKVYEITIGKQKTTIKVLEVERRVNGKLVYHCINTGTDKPMVVSDVARFLREIKPKKPAKGTMSDAGKQPGVLSGLDAAYKVLVEAGRPMKVKEIAMIALENGYCKLKGATPEFTISSAIQRDIAAKGNASRFVKADRGLFAAR